MNTVLEKPAPFICPDCHSVTEPRQVLFRPGAWIEPRGCSACNDLRIQAAEKAEMLRTIDHMESTLDSLLLGRGLTPKLLQARIEQVVPEKLRRLLDSPGGGYIFGPYGTGKSCLFSALIRQKAMDLLARGRTEGKIPELSVLPFFVNVSDLLRRLRLASLGQGENGETEAAIVSLYTYCPSLVLDDVGVRRSTEFVEDCLYEIIDTRDNFLRPTFFSSNYSLRELADHVEPRTVSRIAGMTSGRVVFLGGADRRLTKK